MASRQDALRRVLDTMSYLLISGATGLLGRYLLRDALLNGHRVAVMSRSTPASSGRERIEAVMAEWEAQCGRALPRPEIIDADLSEPGLGISAEQKQWIADNVDAVMHSAASLSFQADPSTGEPYTINVDGTRALVALCQQAGVRDFHLVSTAYVCGRQSGLIPETDARLDAPFGNDYERSKAQAEHIVRSAYRQRCTIYRPSIIVGDSVTGYTSTFRGFYTPLQLACALSGSGGVQAGRSFLHDLGINYDHGKNLVPVDWVSAVTLRIFEDRRLHGGVFHLTNPRTVTVRELEQVIVSVVEEHHRTRAAAPTGSTHTSPGRTRPAMADSEVESAMNVYRSYFGNDPQFDSTQTQRAAPDLPCPAVTREMLEQLGEYAVQSRFACPRRPLSKHHDRLHAAFDAIVAGSPWSPSFELQNRNAQPAGSTEESAIAVQLSGPGGGAWTLTVGHSGIVTAEIGCCGNPQALLYAPTSVFSELARGRLPLEQALLGQMVLRVSKADRHLAMTRLGLVVSAVQRQFLSADSSRAA